MITDGKSELRAYILRRAEKSDIQPCLANEPTICRVQLTLRPHLLIVLIYGSLTDTIQSHLCISSFRWNFCL